jgi:hypothetical protein
LKTLFEKQLRGLAIAEPAAGHGVSVGLTPLQRCF